MTQNDLFDQWCAQFGPSYLKHRDRFIARDADTLILHEFQKDFYARVWRRVALEMADESPRAMSVESQSPAVDDAEMRRFLARNLPAGITPL